MAILTKVEKQQARLASKVAKCESFEERINELTKGGYDLYDAKLKTSEEAGITITALYVQLRWFKQYKENLNNGKEIH